MTHPLYLAGIAVLGLCLALPAATMPPPRHKPDFDRLQQDLSLSDEQASQLRSILDEAREAHENQHRLSREEHHAAREITRERIAEVLDEEQMQQFDALHERRGPRGRRGGKEFAPAATE